MKTITVMPAEMEDWINTAEAARLLGRNERTVQEMGKDGRLNSKLSGRADQPRARIYETKDVLRVAEATRASRPAMTPRPMTNELVATRRGASPKAEKQELRALDTVSLVGNLVAGHKAELQMLVAQSSANLETVVTIAAKNLEAVVTLMLTHQKAEADANRERLKAEREDARERWDIERQDRLDRRKAARAASTKAQAKPVAAKARRAHA